MEENKIIAKEKNNKVLTVLGLIALATLAVIVFRMSYAFFTATVKDTTPDKEDVEVSTAKLEVEYVDGNSNFELGGKIEPGSVLTKEFSVKNNGTDTGYYKIILENIVNTFTISGSLNYTLSRKDGTVLSSGEFPTDSSITLFEQDSVLKDSTNDYIFKLEYVNLGELQNDDMGKKVEAKINIAESDSERRSNA